MLSKGSGKSLSFRSCIKSSGKFSQSNADEFPSVFCYARMVNVSWRGNRYDFFPEVLDPSSRCIDKWIKTTDDEAYEMVRTVM